MADETKTGGIKHDQEKVRMDLLPYDALAEIAKIFTFGAKKYADRNWEKGFGFSRPFAALQRHLTLWFQGEDNDVETGLSHLSHAGCELLFLLAFELRGVGEDDRPKLTKEQVEYMRNVDFLKILPPKK